MLFCSSTTVTPADQGGGVSYRCLLTLDGGAVEAEGRHVLGVALDVKDTLVVPLPRLGLGEVLGSQRDRLGHPNRDVDLGGGQDLWTVLQRGESGGSIKSEEQEDGKKPNTCLLIGGKRRERWRRLTGRQRRSHTFSLKSCAVIHCSHVLQACATFPGLRPDPNASRRGRSQTDRTELSRTDHVLSALHCYGKKTCSYVE